MKTDEFTKSVLIELKKVFSKDLVVSEWNASKNSEDDFNNRDYYAPRVDITIGPFNTNRNLDKNNAKFDILIQQNISLLKKLYEISHLGENYEYISFHDFISTLNPNPRCFIAIEIEKLKMQKDR